MVPAAEFVRTQALPLIALVWLVVGCSSAGTDLAELARVRSGTVDVVVLSSDPGLSQGRDEFTLAFLSADDGRPLDVSSVRVSPSMPMAGMMMFGGAEVEPADGRGRFTVATDLDMAGSWRLSVEWGGPDGGEVTVPLTVR